MLVAAAVVLLVTFAVASALVLLLDELVDTAGAMLAKRLAVASLVALVVDLVCLLLALGVHSADPPADARNDAPPPAD